MRMQAAHRLGATSRMGGTTWLHSGIALGQRVWNTHPEGGAAGLGMAPSRIVRSRFRSTAASGMGTADSSAFE